jgi:Family of unknown function (DUF5343)
MALPSSYYQNIGRISEFFQRIKDANAPDIVSQQLIKDWGFASSNDRALIPLLKTLGFLSADGRPTQRYLHYRDNSESTKVMGEALREAYSDIFLIKANPKPSDKDAVQGKFKSVHNASDLTSNLMAKTFFALLELADLSQASQQAQRTEQKAHPHPTEKADALDQVPTDSKVRFAGLHYNIEIHLPATKDIEVYNSIFKALKEHLIE